MGNDVDLSLLEGIRYRAPLKDFDPRSYEAYWSKQTHPFKYLDAIGIELISDLLLHQYSPKQISETLQISQYLLLRWVGADEEREKAWEWALAKEADNQMYEARDILDEVGLLPEAISKAEKQANHRRNMAKGFGNKRWGQKVDVEGKFSFATVSYNFDIALKPEQQEKIINGQAQLVKEEPAGLIDFNELIGSGMTIPIDIPRMKEEITNAEAESLEAEQTEAEGK